MEEFNLNSQWSKLIIEQLIHLGIEHICIAPGSRSTPLTLAAAENPRIQKHVHFDERGLGYLALGLAKGSKQAVAIIITSGTAVGNLLPSIQEAHADNIPLIILTADRPPELHNVGANQTTDQIKFFNHVVKHQFHLPCPDPVIPFNFVLRTISDAYHQAMTGAQGPVHLNCMFREPLFANNRVNPTSIPYVNYQDIPKRISNLATIQDLSIVLKSNRGLILIGQGHSDTYLNSLRSLAEKLKWPIFIDVLSSMRGYLPQEITYFPFLCREEEDLKPEVILHIGGSFVSKHLQSWLKKLPIHDYIQVSEKNIRTDPSHLVTRRITNDIDLFLQQLDQEISPNMDSSWLESFKNQENHLKKSVHNFFSLKDPITEQGIFYLLSQLPLSNSVYFIGNSMPIRDADNLYYPLIPPHRVVGNRGLSGIDGNIATTVGLARSLNKKIVCLIGDLTLLHDTTSLALIQNPSVHIVFVVINNYGGGIFSFLPIANETQIVDQFFKTKHNHDLQYLANAFKVPYQKMDTSSTLTDFGQRIQQSSGSLFLEILVDGDQNTLQHQALSQFLSKMQVHALL